MADAPSPESSFRRSTPDYVRWARAGCLLVFLAGVVIACYLAWKPSGSLAGLPGLPRGVTDWLDQHGVLRNLPAFAALALPLLLMMRAGRPRLHAAVGLALLAEFIEYAQIWQPSRQFDWRDIWLSLAGIAVAWSAVGLIELMATTLGMSRQTRLSWLSMDRASAEARR